jgi:UDP-N-acetylmuramoyl-L-alanyl-D-glutamate--2,6-diaminopimelate ligase
LFERIVAADGAAVVAADNAHADEVIAAAAGAGCAYNAGRKVRASGLSAPTSTVSRRPCGWSTTARPIALVGAFQVENALVAAGMAIATGAMPPRCCRARGWKARGRLEPIGQRNGAPIFVDYAHKPDALTKALEALRPM